MRVVVQIHPCPNKEELKFNRTFHWVALFKLEDRQKEKDCLHVYDKVGNIVMCRII